MISIVFYQKYLIVCPNFLKLLVVTAAAVILVAVATAVAAVVM